MAKRVGFAVDRCFGLIDVDFAPVHIIGADANDPGKGNRADGRIA